MFKGRVMPSSPRELITVAATLLENLNRLVLEPVVHGLEQVASPRQKTCVACGDRLVDHDAFLRYRGAYYYAEPCLERELPALRAG
jgi:hypothetical protein